MVASILWVFGLSGFAYAVYFSIKLEEKNKEKEEKAHPYYDLVYMVISQLEINPFEWELRHDGYICKTGTDLIVSPPDWKSYKPKINDNDGFTHKMQQDLNDACCRWKTVTIIEKQILNVKAIE